MGSLFSLLNVKPAVADAPGAVPLPRPPPGRGLSVELRGVKFSYYKGENENENEKVGDGDGDESISSTNRRHPILDGLDLWIPAGTSCALVGESGSGKSTVLRLLARFYDADAGQVLVGGCDVRSDVTLRSLRRCVGVVPQDVTLFNDTIEANIAYGRADAEEVEEGEEGEEGEEEMDDLGGAAAEGGSGSEQGDDEKSSPSSRRRRRRRRLAAAAATREEIEAAASAAAVHDAILSMPEGYDTVVGERGLKLSGGEKQRVALARAFLRAPPLLLLDEPTSALDAASEADVLSALRRLSKGRTAVLVAHRLSTAAACDQVVVLEKGKAVESGTHEELLAKENGAYAALWRAAAEAAAGGKLSSSASSGPSSDSSTRNSTSSLHDDDGERAAAAERAKKGGKNV